MLGYLAPLYFSLVFLVLLSLLLLQLSDFCLCACEAFLRRKIIMILWQIMLLVSTHIISMGGGTE